MHDFYLRKNGHSVFNLSLFVILLGSKDSLNGSLKMIFDRRLSIFIQ